MTVYKSISKVRKSYTNAPTATAFSLYINGFDSILGDTNAQNTLKSFLLTKKVTQPIFYMGSLLSSGTNRTNMRAFNTQLHTAGITKRSANVTQASAVDTNDPASKASFNIGCTSDSQKFTHLTEEAEFWHTNDYVANFAEYVDICDTIKAWTDANGVTFDAYFARCIDVAGVATPAEIADYLVATFDTLKLVDYITTDKFNTYKGFSPSIRTQFQLIADAAKRANKVQKIELIYAANGNNGENMRTYFQANPTLLPAYNTSKTEYNGIDFNNKTNLNFLGTTIYALSGVSDL